MTSVAVIGGGITGLSAAYYLSKAPQAVKKIVLLEGSSRVGGWMQSTRTEEGAIFEHGPRSLRTAGEAGANVLGMADDLGLSDQILPVLPSHEGAKNRFIYAGGKLHRLPSSFSGLFKRYELFAGQSPARLGLREPFVPRREEEGDESVHSFFSRRLGQQFADNAIDPMIRGIWAGDCRQLSVQALFPSMYNAERQKGSITRGMLFGPKQKGTPLQINSTLLQQARKERWAIWSLQEGLETLSHALREKLVENGVEILTDSFVERLDFDTAEQVVQVTTLNEQLQVDHVISAVPSQCLAPMLAGCHPVLSDNLSVNPSATVGLVNLEYAGAVLPSEGFGYLVPSLEPEKVLGVVFDSSTFPQHNRPGSATTRLTVMMGGTWFPQQFGDPDKVDTSHLLDVAVETIGQHLNITASPLRSFSVIHKDCIPQYTLGHTDRLEQMDAYIAEQRLPLSLVGCSYRGVGVNDCILSSRKAVSALLETK